MNRDTEQLNRLLQTARRVKPPESAEMPRSLETKILAHWRSLKPDNEFEPLSLLLSRALLGAGLVLVLCLAWNQLADPATPGFILTHLEHVLQITP